MLKHELEGLLGYEITDYAWFELERMYMACELDKYEFADVVRKGAMRWKKEPKDDIVYTFLGYNRNVQAVYLKRKREVSIAKGQEIFTVLGRCDSEGNILTDGLDIVVKRY